MGNFAEAARILEIQNHYADKAAELNKNAILRLAMRGTGLELTGDTIHVLDGHGAYKEFRVTIGRFGHYCKWDTSYLIIGKGLFSDQAKSAALSFHKINCELFHPEILLPENCSYETHTEEI